MIILDSGLFFGTSCMLSYINLRLFVIVTISLRLYTIERKKPRQDRERLVEMIIIIYWPIL